MPNIIFSGDVPNNTPPPLPQGGTPGDGTVTTDKLADDAVTSQKLSQAVRDDIAAGGTPGDGTVATDKLADDAVTSQKLSQAVRDDIAAGVTSFANAVELAKVTDGDHDTIAGNPHSTTAADVGLGAVDNTADADKPVSTATQAAIDSVAETTAVSITKYGAVGTDFTAATGPDCTDALLQHIEKNYTDGVQRPLFFPPGKRYHFNTADPLSLLAARNPTLTADQVWDMTSILSLVGAFPQHETQGREAAGVKHPTEIHVHTTGNSDVWIKKHRRADSVKFGNWSIKNLTFVHPADGKGKFLELGDPAGNYTTGDFRGLTIQDCYFSSVHYHRTARNWMVDSGADGMTYQVDDDYPLIHICNGYDVIIENVGIRGGPSEQILLEQCDAPQLLGVVHSLLAVIGIRVNALPDSGLQGGVPGELHCYIEDPIHVGIVADAGRFIAPRVEVGYDGGYDIDADPYPMVAGITWSIAAGDDKIVFAGFPAGKSLKHYAKAYTTIHVTPTDVSQPPRAFLLTKIDDANGHAFFKESAGGCYVPAAIAGTGDNVIRRHAQSVILHGDSASMTAPSLARNLPSEGQPNWSLVPGRTPMYFETPTHFSGSDPTNQFGEVIKHVVGTQFRIHTPVYVGALETPDHPSVIQNRELVAYDANVLLPLRHASKFDFYCPPGFGVSASNNRSRELLFRKSSTDEPREGKKVWVTRPDDLTASGLQYTLPNFQSMDYTIRCYHPAGSVNLTMYDGVGAATNHALVAGWQTITGTTDVAATLFQINKLTDLEIAWVGFDWI